MPFGELLLHWAGSERRPGDGSSGAGHPGRGVRRIVDRTLSQMTEHPSTLSNHWPKPEVCTLLYKYWPEVCTLLHKYWPKQNSGGEDGGFPGEVWPRPTSGRRAHGVRTQEGRLRLRTSHQISAKRGGTLQIVPKRWHSGTGTLALSISVSNAI